jgi:hypothetical protein
MFCTVFSLPLPSNLSNTPTALTTTATLRHITPLPPHIPFSTVVSALHNHTVLIRLDPEYASHTALPSDSSSPNIQRYKVTDHMNALPAGLWGTTVSFEAEMTDLEDGISWVIKAPLGLVQRTTWKCLKKDTLDDGEREGEGEWCLVEDVEIKANRMLVGTVRGKCEENWKGAHARFLEFVKGEVAKA